MRRLVQPRTIQGKFLYISLIMNLSTTMVLKAEPVVPQAKPPTAVNRQLQTRKFPRDSKIVLKAAIGSLQDLDYTIDVLNSDIGLITASRTTEEKKADVSPDTAPVDASVNPEEAGKKDWVTGCVSALMVFLVVGIFAVVLGNIFGGSDDDDEDDDDNKSSSRNSGSGWSLGRGETNNYYTVDDSPKGPVIYRYKVTINLEELDSLNTQIRVSASGESEQDGAILKTGGIHEPDFFRKFFASMEKSMFLDENAAP
jgi:hypothetical protein